MADSNPFSLSDARWIWPKECSEPNQYINFRQEFNLTEVCSGNILNISADSSYAVWINGSFVHCGQFHDWPNKKTYDTFPISEYLNVGKNVITFLAYYQGETSSQYLKGEPCLIYSISGGNKNVISGKGVLCRPVAGYKRLVSRITFQLHFTFEYDSRFDDDWSALNYAPDKSWRKITDSDTLVPRQDFGPRAVKKIQIKSRVSTKIIAQGLFKRTNNSNELLSQTMYHDFLSTRLVGEVFENACVDFETAGPVRINKILDSGNDGVYLVLDLGREEVGLFELDIEANEGMLVDIAYGEHLDDLRVRSVIGGRNFSNRYIAKEGRQTFTHYFTRFSCRYIQLHISNMKQNCTLHYAGLRCIEYPVQEQGVFNSACNLQNKIYTTAIRTLHLSMHEHYEDSPWREQALYANDARNQALCGYYCFGEYDFPKHSFDLLGRGLKSDCFLELCAPSQLPITIPSFSMVWVLAVADHLLYSGNTEYAQAMYPIVKIMINSWLSMLKDGLLPCPIGPRYWHFYDWASGLDGTLQSDCTRFDVLENLRYDAILNLLLCLALESASVLANGCGDTESGKNFELQAQKIKTKSKAVFFDSTEGLFTTYIGDTVRKKHFAQLTQSLALLAGICSNKEAEFIRNELICGTNNMVETTLSQSFYKFEALLQDKERYGKHVFDLINNDWGKMLFQGATSFWETLKGGWDFDLAGSLCHGWSAVPVYCFHAHLLGIKPLVPGFKKFLVHPSFNALNYCNGQVPTPYGSITVTNYKMGEILKCRIQHPKELVPVIADQVSGEVIFEFEDQI